MLPPLRAQSFQVSVKFPPTEDVSAPSRTGGGGTRGGCLMGRLPLTPIVPSNNLVTTVSAHPTLFWYVPGSRTNTNSALFVLLDSQDNKVYQTTLALKGTPGIVKLSIPTTVSLQSAQNYKWQFSVLCNQDSEQVGGYVEGSIERTQLNSQQKLQLAAAKDPLQQAEVYAQARVWQETLAIVSQLRQNRPHDSKIAEAWNELLESVDLKAIASAPLLDCCSADNAQK
ncbi:MAG TPA: DUF928 domain-containing protein [Allocoleopsis sp.]